MTVEIRELTINAKISHTPNGKKEDSQTSGPIDDQRKEEIVATCVEQVLRVLERMKER